uniref:Putative secreted protein n=1 Tax=Ixodes scapularis TaxID=6945 RepID=A0A4D5RY43_IXOSC
MTWDLVHSLLLTFGVLGSSFSPCWPSCLHDEGLHTGRRGRNTEVREAHTRNSGILSEERKDEARFMTGDIGTRG